MAQERISDVFLEGIHEVFSILMTDKIFLKLLDENSTEINIYNEASVKKYHDPIQLVGKVSLGSEQGEQEVEGNQDLATFTIPTKSLLDRGVDITPQNHDTLEKGVIQYEGVDYEVKQVTPRTNIDSVFQFYVFYCEKPKTRR